MRNSHVRYDGLAFDVARKKYYLSRNAAMMLQCKMIWILDMAFFQILKEITSGLTRGFALFFCERSDFVSTSHLPSVSARKHY